MCIFRCNYSIYLKLLIVRVFLYTTFALVAFAFNSILCRLALRGEEADAAGFTTVRLVSGAVALVVIWYLVGRSTDARAKNTLPTGRVSALGSWASAFFLFAYAVCFSFAYLGLTAGSGALILFGSVQMSMVTAAIFKGERPSALESLGLVIAVSGLIYLVLPGLASPPLTSSLLMAAAGMSWAAYTLRGKSSTDPLADTAGNFVRSLPMAAVVAIVFLPNLQLTPRGWLLAIVSGAITSGVGYTIWYSVVKNHTTTRAAVLQLAVPVIAAMIGIIWLGETATATLGIAAAMILGGIAVTIAGKRA